MTETLYATNGSAVSREPQGSMMSREEHILKEMGLNRDQSKTPRRSRSTYEYQIPSLPSPMQDSGVQYTVQRREQWEMPYGLPSPISETNPELMATEGSEPRSPAELDTLSLWSASSGEYSKEPERVSEARPRRPALPPPRRSYSVMDYEPVPHTHRPSANMTLLDLPSELHYAIFDSLDPIDGTCLGLTNKHFYTIHRRMHGTVPLSTRRAGPNDMEWAWHLAGTILSNPSSSAAVSHGDAIGENEKKALAMLRVRGHAYCRICGISRCELHKHIQGWMGAEYEYCTVRQRFGPKAPEGAKSFCYLSNPKKPGRCGRHRVAKTQEPPSPAVSI